MSNYFPTVRSLSEKLYQWIAKRPTLHARVLALAERHNQWMGYRAFGLLRDDLLSDEHPVIKEALTRLPDQLHFDRTFRQRRAIQLNMNHEQLPKDQWVTPEQDQPYLFPIVLQVCKERDERDLFDTLEKPNAQLFNETLARMEAKAKQAKP